jgi:hypothetical protein
MAEAEIGRHGGTGARHGQVQIAMSKSPGRT